MAEFLTPQEAAERLGVSPESLRRWASEGRISELKTPGGHRRYDHDEIAALMMTEFVLKGAMECLPEGGHVFSPREGVVPLGFLPLPELPGSDGNLVGIENRHLDQNLLVVGRTGSGKSCLLETTAIAVAKDGYPMICIGEHGDRIQYLIAKCVPERAKDIVVIDFNNQKTPVSFNPLDISDSMQIGLISRSLAELLLPPGTPRAILYTEQALIALMEANMSLPSGSKLNFFHLYPFFTSSEFRYAVTAFATTMSVRESFDPDTGLFEMYSDHQRQEILGPILRALSYLDSTKLLRVFAASDNKLDFVQLMKEKKIVVIKPSASPSQIDGVRFASVLALFQALSTVDRWAKVSAIDGSVSGTGCRIFIDNLPGLLYNYSSLYGALSETRKFDIGLIYSCQSLDFFPSEAKSLLGNTASFVAFTSDPATAEKLVSRLPYAKREGDSRPQLALRASDIFSLPLYHFMGAILITDEEEHISFISPPFRAKSPGLPTALIQSLADQWLENALDAQSRPLTCEGPPPDRMSEIMAALSAAHTDLVAKSKRRE